jgi:transposase
VVRVANRCLDAVRRRVQNQTLGHRGRKDDPLYRIRKLLLTDSERLNERGCDRILLSLRTGDPNNEVVGAWLAKESVRDVYLADNYADAAVVLDKAIAGCRADEVAEIRSLGNTLASWRTEILARHTTGASNGPTEGLNLCVKKVKRLSAMVFDGSTTTGSGCCSTPAASPGRNDPHRRASEHASPHSDEKSQ